MAFLVYKLTCTVSSKAYIGITSRSLNTRWLEHCARARQSGREESRLYAAMRKYGLDAFTREVIDTCDTEEGARRLETVYVRQFDAYAAGYNANEGGRGHLHVPAHVRKKIGDAQVGKVISVDCRAKMSAAKAGRSECADHLGAHTQKGDANPRAGSYLVQGPSGRLLAITGLRAFCRDNSLSVAHLQCTLTGKRPQHKGYKLMRQLGFSNASHAPAHPIELTGG